MDIGKTLYVTTRKAWRAWLAKHHARKKEIWLVYYRKNTGKARIPYDDAVEEALCFGWIDSVAKPFGEGSWAQRFSPRRKGSNLSPTNRVRVERLIAKKRMTKAGLDALRHELEGERAERTRRAVVPRDIAKALEKDPVVWRNFRRFSEAYRRIRVGWIDGARVRPDVFRKRLRYFIEKTRKNEQFGMVR